MEMWIFDKFMCGEKELVMLGIGFGFVICCVIVEVYGGKIGVLNCIVFDGYVMGVCFWFMLLVDMLLVVLVVFDDEFDLLGVLFLFELLLDYE